MSDDSATPPATELASSQRLDGALGVNAWLVEEMYQSYRADPSSVSESWREFFADYRSPMPVPASPTPSVPGGFGEEPLVPSGADAAAVVATGTQATVGMLAAGPAAVAVPSVSLPAPSATPGAAVAAHAGNGSGGAAPARAAGPQVGPDDVLVPLRGAPGRLVVNMVASLAVPTATSVHPVPAKLVEVNRRAINEHLARSFGGKVSFTHLIGWAVVQALVAVPALNASFVEDADGRGTPGVVRYGHVGLGLATDLPRPDGSRSLVVPVVKRADTLDFSGFWHAYEDLVRRARTGKLAVDDFAGCTITLTNPGTLGTSQSVPRLMAGQGAIVGVGSLDYPAALAAADPATIAELGLSKVVTLTSTYDHRVVQGAESGLFLSRVHELLVGEHGFYESVFDSLGVPLQPARLERDHHPASSLERERNQLEKQVQVQALINMYRVRGHLIAQLDPLQTSAPMLRPDLDPSSYGLTVWDLDRPFLTGGLAGRDVMTLGEILQVLRDAYCRTIGVEYMHIQEPEEKRFLQEHLEGVATALSPDEQHHVLRRLNAAEAFERFLHSRYVGQKRFGLEGAESTIAFLDASLDEAVRNGVEEAVLGMAHRGRLNVLANIVGKSYSEIFAEFEGNLDPETVQGSGDVKYHKGAVGKFTGRGEVTLPVTLVANPSHLEAVDGVVEGIVRAKQDELADPSSFAVLPLLIHGDAAFAGQGVVAETLNLSQLEGYRTGGTVHLVINNQLGFTTLPTAARSSVYATDVAKMVQAPIFHVNGDDPEACVRVARLAVAYRQAFRKDVVVDLLCYRRHGHNEGDDPSYTQPLMYRQIDQHRSVRKLYTEALVKRGDITLEEAEQALEDFANRLQQALDETRSAGPVHFERLPERHLVEPPPLGAATGVPAATLEAIASRLHSFPPGFTPHPKLERQLATRARLFTSGEVDWSLAEALAFGSLVLEGTDVRLSGQDTRRGTFSQRHAVVVDYLNGEEHVPLSRLHEPVGDAAALAGEGHGRFLVLDSLRSEYAALAFEYGYSVEARDALVAWEAQFGDFSNGAQIVIDQFLVAAEEKWGQSSGLVLLLPHGYEGQGAEHSSARLERFLTLAADNNITVTQPTTAAQYFHLLRSQSARMTRRPLVVMTPKSILRSRQSRSLLGELVSGGWRPVLDDPERALIEPGEVRRIVATTGKIAFDAVSRRQQPGVPPFAVVRVEQLYPWPEELLVSILAGYPNASEVVWLQDEPENMGAWSYVHDKLHRVLRGRYELRHVSRRPSGSPATGSHALHELELADLLDRALGLPLSGG